MDIASRMTKIDLKSAFYADQTSFAICGNLFITSSYTRMSIQRKENKQKEARAQPEQVIK